MVTAVEMLSPSNKRKATPGWDIYLRKRQALLMGTANLVEIDLLRGGQRMPMLDSWPVPLLKPDPDVPLNLQPMVEAIYARSKYYCSIDYSKPLTPSTQEAAWIEQQSQTRRP